VKSRRRPNCRSPQAGESATVLGARHNETVRSPDPLDTVGTAGGFPAKLLRISELLDSRFGTVVTVFDTTVRRRQIACPPLRNSWDGRLDFGHRPEADIQSTR